MKRRIIIILGIILVVLVVLLLIVSHKTPTTNGQTGIIQKAVDLFPFGKNVAHTPSDNTTTDIITSGTETTSSSTGELPRLRKLTDVRIAGATTLIKERPLSTETPAITETTTETTPTETTTPDLPTTEIVNYIRYVEKATGNIYDIAVDESESTRITNTTIPRVVEALFANNGERVLLRYLEGTTDTIRTWNAIVGEATETGLHPLTGTFLEDNITSLSVSPDTRSLFYIRSIGDTTYGYTAQSDGTGIKQIFDSSFSEWLSSWQEKATINLTAKASGFFEGYSYDLSSDGKSFIKIGGPIFGFTTLPDPTGKYVLLGSSTANGMRTFIYNKESGETYPLAATTLPEKCVWSYTGTYFYCAVPKNIPKGAYPDEWYQGLVSFNDTIWKFDANYGIGFLIEDIYKESGEVIDAINLGLTPDESFLYFTNKKDDSLWGLTL